MPTSTARRNRPCSARPKSRMPRMTSWSRSRLRASSCCRSASWCRPGQALAWRGPMASGALNQLIEGDWGDTEIILVDLPPGTGDVQLSLVQKSRPAGAVIVSTPQDLSLIDATRAIDLFGKTSVPVLGHHREYGRLSMPALRREQRPVRTGRRGGFGGKSLACRSSAACRCPPACARHRTPGDRPPRAMARPPMHLPISLGECWPSWRKSTG